MSSDFVDKLKAAIYTGFMGSKLSSESSLQPSLVVNDPTHQKSVLAYIQNKLDQCDEFWFSVAFLTSSGVVCLHNSLKEFVAQEKKGQLFVSDYLAFTKPCALEKISQFKPAIEAKLLRGANYHGKAYLFRTGEQYDLLLGSSNLTAAALCTNEELNIHLTMSFGGKIRTDFSNMFTNMFERAVLITPEVIKEYKGRYESNQLRLKGYTRSAADIESAGEYGEHAIHDSTPAATSTGAELMAADAFFKPTAMQHEALTKLQELRGDKKDRALVISATGTGKTALAAFDVQNFKAERMLFVVHRERIAQQAMKTFQAIFGGTRSMGLYSGSAREYREDFIFATVQTISRPEHMGKFSQDCFDYIIIDEAHRAAASTYKTILGYFKPRFILGMTATPERTDECEVFSLFDHNIACEIRLHTAMEDGLLCPFHYFGIADILVAGSPVDEDTDFSCLVADERVKNIMQAVDEYGCDDGEARGLIFCSRVDEACELAAKLNAKGYKTIALSGKDDESARAAAMEAIESDDADKKLDYILTVDIFNEGIDIPRLNQIIMLRPTQSAIIFIQQLGRGLRKSALKDYVTVIDFIGNYKNNYMVPTAIFGDCALNKDNLRQLVSSGSPSMPGVSTVNFDRVAKERILQSIDRARLINKSNLVDNYRFIKRKIGRAPMMMDFIHFNGIDPYCYVKFLKSFFNFVMTIEQDDGYAMPATPKKLLEYLSSEINNGKRATESLIIQLLIQRREIKLAAIKQEHDGKLAVALDDKTLSSAINNINLNFVTGRSSGHSVPIGKLHGFSLVHHSKGLLTIADSLRNALACITFRTFLEDSLNYGISEFQRRHQTNDFLEGFIRYQRYSRKDVFRILNWPENPNPQTVGGYMVSKDGSNCAIFVNYHKAEGIAETINYGDKFMDAGRFRWMSKSRRSLKSPDVKAIIEQKDSNIRLPLFIKKSNKSGIDEANEFLFVGDLTPIETTFCETEMPVKKGQGVPVVRIDFAIDKPVEPGVLKYLTDE